MEKKSPIRYLDYDKISDTLLYFSKDIVFRFNVQLAKKSSYDERRNFFHKEFEYESKYSDVGNVRSIRRDMTFFYTIDDNRDYMNGFMIGIADVFPLKMLLEKQVLPWYIGNKSIYGTSPDDRSIIIKGRWKPQQFAISDYKYIQFMPIVMTYENNITNCGIRLIINKETNFVDIDLNKFLGFYQIIAHTDMYAVACSMVTYVKSGPYDINKYIPYQSDGPNYFDKL